MPLSRRSFLAASVAGLAASRRQSLALPTQSTTDPRGYDPWLEIDVAAIQHNVRAVSRLSGGRPILAVVKNNAYGLGLATAGPILDRQPQVAGRIPHVGESRVIRHQERSALVPDMQAEILPDLQASRPGGRTASQRGR